MPLLADRHQVAIKQEAAAGTIEALAAANVLLTARRPTFTPDIEIVDREAMSATLGKRGHTAGRRFARIGFAMYLRGTSGAPADPGNLPDFAVPFRGCGLVGTFSGTAPNEQSEWKPTTSFYSDETTGPYCTVGSHFDGKLYRIHGAVGNMVLTLVPGRPWLAEFDYTGVYNTPTDVALLSPTYPTIVEPPFANAAVSFFGFTAARLSQIVLNLNNEIVLRPNPNSSTSLFTAQIVGRNPSLTLDPEEVLAATEDWWADLTNNATGAFDTGVTPSGGTNYNQLRLQAPKVQYRGVALADREKMLTANLELACLVNSDAGDDEVSLIQT